MLFVGQAHRVRHHAGLVHRVVDRARHQAAGRHRLVRAGRRHHQARHRVDRRVHHLVAGQVRQVHADLHQVPHRADRHRVVADPAHRVQAQVFLLPARQAADRQVVHRQVHALHRVRHLVLAGQVQVHRVLVGQVQARQARVGQVQVRHRAGHPVQAVQVHSRYLRKE